MCTAAPVVRFDPRRARIQVGGGLALQELLGEPDMPDLYVDAVRIAVGAYGFVLEMGVQGVPDTAASEAPPVKRLARIRMSPQHALIVARLLTKNVQIYQDKIGRIQLPPEAFKALDLDPE